MKFLTIGAKCLLVGVCIAVVIKEVTEIIKGED